MGDGTWDGLFCTDRSIFTDRYRKGKHPGQPQTLGTTTKRRYTQPGAIRARPSQAREQFVQPQAIAARLLTDSAPGMEMPATCNAAHSCAISPLARRAWRQPEMPGSQPLNRPRGGSARTTTKSTRHVPRHHANGQARTKMLRLCQNFKPIEIIFYKLLNLYVNSTLA